MLRIFSPLLPQEINRKVVFVFSYHFKQIMYVPIAINFYPEFFIKWRFQGRACHLVVPKMIKQKTSSSCLHNIMQNTLLDKVFKAKINSRRPLKTSIHIINITSTILDLMKFFEAICICIPLNRYTYKMIY